MDVDVAVIGGGAVGLAVALELSRTRQVAVIERHAGLGRETSSHNSGVIHAGIYYPTGSLKHTLCIEGNRLIYEWAAAHGVRATRIGKLIVAVDASEIEALDGVAQHAAENGVPDMRLIRDVEKLRAMEPAVRCAAGLWSGSTGIIDQTALVASYASAVLENGGWIALRHEAIAIERSAAGFDLCMIGPDGGEVTASAAAVVNSAGLAAPQVASMLRYPLDGGDDLPALRQRVNKGRYYDIINPKLTRALHHLIYPLPEHARGGLGVHVTLDVDGAARLGPDTEWLDDGAELDYRADDERRLAFHAAANRYLPSLQPDDLAPGQVGYRPKLQDPGGGQADFLIWHDRGYVHLGGIESPGLTASLAIARRVAVLL